MSLLRHLRILFVFWISSVVCGCGEPQQAELNQQNIVEPSPTLVSREYPTGSSTNNVAITGPLPSMATPTLNFRAINLPAPVLPKAIAKKRISARVVVQVFVEKDGHVVSATALFGPKPLRPFAVEAARKTTIEPLVINGEPKTQSGALIFKFDRN